MSVFEQFSMQKSFRNGSKTCFRTFGGPQGPKNFACGAETGLKTSITNAMIVYPADDLINGNIFDEMYKLYLKGYDIVAPSRFMKGGSMKNCPLLKEILVRFASYSLFILHNFLIRDVMINLHMPK